MKQTTLFGHTARSAAPTRPQASPKRKRRSSPQYEAMPTSRRKGKQRATPDSESGDMDSDMDTIHLEKPADDIIDLEDSDEQSSPKRPSPKKRRLNRTRAESSSEDTVATEVDDPDGDAIAFRTQRARKAWRTKSLVLDSDDEEKPPKSKLVKQRPRTPEEDMEDEVDREYILTSRLRDRNNKSSKRSTYLENLERLKRKKRGDSSPINIFGSDDDEEDEDGSDEAHSDQPIRGARPTHNLNGDDDDEEEDDIDGFVVQDDEAQVELPAEFNMNSHQDLSHQFKIICQLFVHAAVAEDREVFLSMATKNQYFGVPLQATRKKLLGMRDSLVTSSMWKTEFKRPLEQFPDLDVTVLDFSLPGCAACRMGSRTSTRSAHLSGHRYFSDTYELQPDAEESEEEENQIEKGFHLGRFCARRTQVYHSFCHWEFKLFQALDREIDSLRKSRKKGFVRVARAGGRKPPQDLSKADDIVDWLDQRGIVDQQYEILKDMIESARNLEVAAKRGGDDGDD